MFKLFYKCSRCGGIICIPLSNGTTIIVTRKLYCKECGQRTWQTLVSIFERSKVLQVVQRRNPKGKKRGKKRRGKDYYLKRLWDQIY